MDSAPESPADQTPPNRQTLQREPPSIPDHELSHRIGAGAYGEVWLARNLATGALRAVKMVYRSTFADDRPFNREFEGIKKFDAVSRSHPSQLALFHVGRNDTGGYFYYVMELADPISVGVDVRRLSSKSEIRDPKSEIDGPPHLGSYIAHTLRADLEHGRLPAGRTLEIALALTEALAHLHAHGLIHRDVKPSNIIFVGGRPKLADIGLVTDASDTRSIVGTEGYLAPEGPGTAAADIYALGKVIFEMTTGLDRRRFPELPEDLRTWPDRREVIELNEIVLKACAKDPTLRYSTADAMLADLKLLTAGKSVQRRRTLQRAWIWTWKSAVYVAIVSICLLALKSERERRASLAKQSLTPWQSQGTTNQAAWQAVQRAMRIGGAAYTAAGLSNSIPELERAIALDPNYSGAWSLLSLTLTLAVTEGYLPGTNALPRAKFCVEKAISINPQDYPYGVAAQCSLALDYDFAKAERLFRKDIEGSRGNWISRNNFAWELIYQRQFAEAGQIFMRIMQEQPAQGSPYIALGLIGFVAGNELEALKLLDQGIQLAADVRRWTVFPNDPPLHVGDHTKSPMDWISDQTSPGQHDLTGLRPGVPDCPDVVRSCCFDRTESDYGLDIR